MNLFFNSPCFAWGHGFAIEKLELFRLASLKLFNALLRKLAIPDLNGACLGNAYDIEESVIWFVHPLFSMGLIRFREI